ncbi:MAG: sulfatase-like hydrolase/transferase, partial [Woeseiaceae bacterium]|nr:sulfatase-like hydrolase/transferase [Woeseiaceae bacterium]
PNVVLIVTDNQSEQLLGAYGNRDIRTPNIDTLARDGMRFTRAYAASGVCSPTRATLLTGLLPSQHGVHNGLHSVFPVEGWAAVHEFRSLPQTLGDAGYDTALIGKYHLGAPERPQMGFRHWVTFPTGHTTSFHDVTIIDNGEAYALEGEHLTDFWTRKATEYIATREPGRPFFLYLAYNGPYNLPPLVTRPPENRYADYYAEHVPEFPQEPVHPYLRNAAIEESSVEDVRREQAEYRAWGVTDAESTGAAGATPEMSYAWQTIHALNNKTAMINLASETTMIDDGVGRVLAALEEHGFAGNTIVVFTSDQGSAFGQHGLWGNSSWAKPHPVYREHMQVPLIVRLPGVVPAGRVADGIVNQFDIFPTLLDLAGFAGVTIENSPGRSFAPTLRGEDQPGAAAAYFEYITARAIVTGEWKLVERLFGAPSELYHLASDPREEQNLYGDPAHEEIARTLARQLGEFFLEYANPQYDPWRGGTGKALLMYSDRNERFIAEFPGWQPPLTEPSEPFSDL